MAKSSPRYASATGMMTQLCSMAVARSGSTSVSPVARNGPLTIALDDQREQRDQHRPGDEDRRVQHRDPEHLARPVEERQQRVVEQQDAEQEQRDEALALHRRSMHRTLPAPGRLRRLVVTPREPYPRRPFARADTSASGAAAAAGPAGTLPSTSAGRPRSAHTGRCDWPAPARPSGAADATAASAGSGTPRSSRRRASP